MFVNVGLLNIFPKANGTNMPTKNARSATKKGFTEINIKSYTL